MAKVKTAMLGSTVFDIYVDRHDGYCTDPRTSKDPVIGVPDGLPYGSGRGAKKGLESLIHEVLHAMNFNRAETKIESEARQLTNLLWRLGYRRVRTHV